MRVTDILKQICDIFKYLTVVLLPVVLVVHRFKPNSIYKAVDC